MERISDARRWAETSGLRCGAANGCGSRRWRSCGLRDRSDVVDGYTRSGASHDEIAGAIGVQPSSMKLLLFRARRRMAELLGGGK